MDYDRGVEIRQIGKGPNVGVEVYMYIDDPGFYFSVHGNQINEELAAEAGYPIEKYARARKIKEGLKEYEAKLRAELDLTEASRRVVKEFEGFQVIELSQGRCQVVSPDGVVLNNGTMPEAEALKLLDAITTA